MVATGLAYDAAGARGPGEGARAPVAAGARHPPLRQCRARSGWTAAGRFDAYFERTVKPWDIAAGALICERAGLRVLEFARARGFAVRASSLRRRRWRSRCWSCGRSSRRAGVRRTRGRGEGARRPTDPGTVLGAGGRGGLVLRFDAAGGSRTHTPLRTEAFEASASTIPPPPHGGRDISGFDRRSGRERRGVGGSHPRSPCPRRPRGRAARPRRSSPG